MFWISNDEELETKKNILKEYNVIDEKGKILTPIMGINLPVENHPGLVSNLSKEIQKLINKFAGKENHQNNKKNNGDNS